MREIEIKARVKDERALLLALEKLTINLDKPVKQHDVVYGEPGGIDGSVKSNWLRIRTENDSKVLFTLKRSVVGHLDSIEHEVVVDSAEELESIIKLLGFELYSDITKTRRKAKYGDIEICYDNLGKLGMFIEAEKLMPSDADHDEVESELWGLFEKLGISKDDQEHFGYDVLERKTRGL